MACATIGPGLVAVPCMAQQAEEAPRQIDILIPQEDFDAPLEDCSAEQEAASISGEIVVCRRRRSGREFGYDEERAEQRYAAETMNKGDPRAPDFGESCKKNPQKGMCIGFGKVPPPAYFVDFDAIPEAPPGSDADRVGRGLAPRGIEAPVAAQDAREAELGLPPVPTEITPSGSASPAAEPSG